MSSVDPDDMYNHAENSQSKCEAVKASGSCRRSTEAEDTCWVGANPSIGGERDEAVGTTGTDQEGSPSRAHLLHRRSETWGVDEPGAVSYTHLTLPTKRIV